MLNVMIGDEVCLPIAANVTGIATILPTDIVPDPQTPNPQPPDPNPQSPTPGCYT